MQYFRDGKLPSPAASDAITRTPQRPIDLTPIECSSKPQTPFAVCDIEVRAWVNFLVIGYYDGIDVQNFTCLTEFVAFCMTSDEVPTTIYAHFGSIFDFQFILGEVLSIPGLTVENIIPRGTGVLCFDVTDGNRTITFSDSSAFLPFALRSLCEAFQVEHMKLDIDYSRITHVTPRLLKYLKHDLMGLYECIEKFRNWDLVKQAGPKLTMASQAVQVLRLFLKEKVSSLDCEDTPDLLSPDSFVRTSYFGGRTEIFKPLYEYDWQGEPLPNRLSRRARKKLKLFDVNSLYPTVMRDCDMPNAFVGTRKTYNGSLMGFYKVKVRVPKKLKIPPLGTVLKVKNAEGELNEKFVFPTGTFWGCWSTVELEYAKTLGVEILEVEIGYIFENGGKIFKGFVEALYEMRQEAKRNKDTVTDLLAKLLMNSCYGRFGLNKVREQLTFDKGEAHKDIHSVIHTRNGDVRLVTEEKVLETSFANVAVAAWVTSQARIYMHKIYRQCEDECYYTDTDSIFTTKNFPEGDKLGELKLEYTASNACFLLPKTYFIDDMLNYSVWNATYYPRRRPQITSKRGAPFSIWWLPVVVNDKFRVGMNECTDNILGALETTGWTEKTGLEVPGLDEVLVHRSENRVEIRLRDHGTLVLKLAHKKVVMKGFDRKKIMNFDFEDFVYCLEGEMRMHKPGMGPKPLFVDIAPKFATFKTAVRKGKMVTMTEMTHRAIKASYDKRKIFKKDGLYDTKPLHMKASKSLGCKALQAKA